MARVRGACHYRRTSPSRSRSDPTALGRRPARAVPTETPATAKRARDSPTPNPPLTALSLHSTPTRTRLVALASGRRPVSDGGFTGVRRVSRLASAERAAHPASPYLVSLEDHSRENQTLFFFF
jgi:hypothetical protein